MNNRNRSGIGLSGAILFTLTLLACGQQAVTAVGPSYLAPVQHSRSVQTAVAELGELIFEYTVQFTEYAGYATGIMTVVTDLEALPPQGALFDMAFEGTVNGPRLKGTIAGMEYVHVQPNGDVQLHIHASITTHDGLRIALLSNGIALPENGSSRAQVFHEAELFTSSPQYSWVNDLQLSTQGIVDPVKGEVKVLAFDQ